MIDVQQEATCKLCGKPIEQGKGRRKREYCSDAHKERAYRERKQAGAAPTLEQQNTTAALEKLSAAGAKIEKLTATIAKQRDRIDELSTKNRALSKTIDELASIEEAFSTDTGMHPLKRYLASHPYHAVRPGCVKVLDPESGFVPSGSRGTYTDAMRRAGFTADEQADVWDAWRDMLKAELFASYYANRDKS